MNVYTSGSFDLFHVGHLNILKRAKALCEGAGKLVVGVHTDESIFRRKNRQCIIPFEQRFAIVQALDCVDICVKLNSFDEFEQQIRDYDIGKWVLGDDYIGVFDYLKPLCDVIYLPRTQGISTTEIINKIKTQV